MERLKPVLAPALSALLILLSPGAAGLSAAAEIVGPKIQAPAAKPIAAEVPSALNPVSLPAFAALEPLAAAPTLAVPEISAAAQLPQAGALAAGQALGARLAAVEPNAPAASAQSAALLDQVMDGAAKAGDKADRAGAVSAGAGAVAMAVAHGVGALTASKAAVFGLLPAALWLGGRALTRRSVPQLRDAAAHPIEDRAEGFRALFGGESLSISGARLLRWAAFATMDAAGMLALHHFKANPAAGALYVIAAAIGYYALRRTKALDKAVHLLRVAAYGRLREGKPQRSLESIPGATGLEKHVGYFAGGQIRVRFSDTFRNLRGSGEAVQTALVTALAAHLTMSGKTQAGLTPQEKKSAGLRRFDIYRPNIGRALMPSDSGAFAVADKADGTKRGDVDLEKFETLFRYYAGGRGYVTAKDLARRGKADYARDAGKASLLKRLIGRYQSKRSFDQMLAQLGDRVVVEDGKLVPAISKPQLLWLYQGRAMYDLIEERTGRDLLSKRPE